MMIQLMILMKFQSSFLWFWWEFTCILLQTHSEQKEEYLVAMQKPKLREKKLSSVRKPTNYCKSYKLMLLFLRFEWAYNIGINKVSERLTFGIIKVIMPCVEGDRSDFQPSKTTIALSLQLRAIELASGWRSDLRPSTQGMIFIIFLLSSVN